MAILEKLSKKNWLAKTISLLAGAFYIGQSIYDAHFLDVTMDEGTYLMKGMLYLTGVYKPFQPYGPWTNKMPLAFTIPGLAQALFEPGLRTGRYFAVFLSVLMLFGLWLVTYRLRGHWWAAALTTVMALNAGNITIYARALSQGVTVVVLVWALVFILDREQRLWQTTLGAALSMLLVFVRQNMAPVPLLVVLFIFWAYGRKHGFYALAVTGLIFIGFHWYYWPDILKLWRPHLPGFAADWITAMLAKAGWQTTPSTSNWSTDYGFLTDTFVFFEGVRMNFFAFIGLLTTWIFWPRQKDWKNQLDLKTSVLLSVLVIILTTLHAYASFGLNYCLYCFNGYLAFFMPAGLLLIAISAPYWKKKTGWLPQTLAILVILLACTGIAYGSYQITDEFLMKLPVPRMKNMQILPGSTEIWVFLRNKFSLPYETLQQAIPAAAGLLFGIAFVLIGLLICRLKGKKPRTVSAGFAILLAFLILGTLLSPIKVLGGGKFADYCYSDVIASHETVGAELASQIPPGSQVYWHNDVSPLPLLYLSGREFYPPQLNHWYSFREGGEPNIMLQNGLWNAELKERWIEEADYLLVAEKYVPEFEARENFALLTDELTTTDLTVICRDRSFIHVYKRVK